MEGIRQDTRLAVARLEGQVARLRALVWLLVLLLLAGAGYAAWRLRHAKAAAGPEVLTVKGLVVEDADGHPRLVLAAPGLTMSDADGRSRLELGLQPDGAGRIQLKDASGAPALSATQGALALKDAKQDEALVTTAGGATVQLRRGDKVVFKQPWDAPELK